MYWSEWSHSNSSPLSATCRRVKTMYACTWHEIVVWLNHIRPREERKSHFFVFRNRGRWTNLSVDIEQSAWRQRTFIRQGNRFQELFCLLGITTDDEIAWRFRNELNQGRSRSHSMTRWPSTHIHKNGDDRNGYRRENRQETPSIGGNHDHRHQVLENASYRPENLDHHWDCCACSRRKILQEKCRPTQTQIRARTPSYFHGLSSPLSSSSECESDERSCNQNPVITRCECREYTEDHVQHSTEYDHSSSTIFIGDDAGQECSKHHPGKDTLVRSKQDTWSRWKCRVWKELTVLKDAIWNCVTVGQSQVNAGPRMAKSIISMPSAMLQNPRMAIKRHWYFPRPTKSMHCSRVYVSVWSMNRVNG